MEIEAALVKLGFTNLEAEIYCALLRESPLTAYRLGQVISRSPANVYQPLKSLCAKGAVLVNADSSSTSSYVPVLPERLISAMRGTYLQQSADALAALELIHKPTTDVTVVQLQQSTQVIEHARSMIESAKEAVLFDCMPPLWDLLRPTIDAAKSRSVRVSGLVYRPEDARPGIFFAGQAAIGLEERWPGFGITVVCDARELLIAMLSQDLAQVVTAIYSDSIFLSCLMHNIYKADIRLSGIETLGTGESAEDLLSSYVPLGQRLMAESAKACRSGGKPSVHR